MALDLGNLNVGKKHTTEWGTGIGVTELYLSRDGALPRELLTTMPGDDDPSETYEFEWDVTGPAAAVCQTIVKDLFDDQEVVMEEFSIIDPSTVVYNSGMCGGING